MDNGENKRKEQDTSAWWEGREMAVRLLLPIPTTIFRTISVLDVLFCLCRYICAPLIQALHPPTHRIDMSA